MERDTEISNGKGSLRHWCPGYSQCFSVISIFWYNSLILQWRQTYWFVSCFSSPAIIQTNSSLAWDGRPKICTWMNQNHETTFSLKHETELTVSVLKKIQNTQEIKTTLFNYTKQDKSCKFSRNSSFSSYVQQYNRKPLNQLVLCQFDARRLAGGKGHETAWRDKEKGVTL